VHLFTTIAGLRCYLNSLSQGNGPLEVGLVPTMGALHAGHLSLIQRCRQENSVAVVSIFVNPLQFAPQEDFDRYPRNLERDRQVCEQAGVDVIFAPTPEAMGVVSQPFSPLLTAVVPPEAMTTTLCGRTRLGHFQGVATIVTKLLNVVQPDRAYFGQKDGQQLAIIRRLVADLNLPVEIIACPTVREPSGLALSSRNQYLSELEKGKAALIYQALQQADKGFRAGERSGVALVGAVKAVLEQEPAIALEYVELVHPTTLAPLTEVEDAGLLAVAVRLGSTRLIDNIVLVARQPIVAIDGPAGAGKSTVARRVAQELGLLYLDTGAMYRAITWLVLQSGIALDDQPAIAELVSQADVLISGEPQAVSVSINGRDVTQEIRSLEVTAHVSAIAAQSVVRQELLRLQRRYGLQGGLVIEGRDIGTCVFPDAELKIFLTASVQERARRRQQDLLNQGKGEMNLEELEQTIAERDHKDSTRAIAPLRKAADAIEVNTDDLTIDQVVNRIIQMYQARALS